MQRISFPLRRIDLLYAGSKGRTSRRIDSFRNQIRPLARIPTPVTRFPVRHPADLWPTGQVPVTAPLGYRFTDSNLLEKETGIVEPFTRNSNDPTIRKKIIFIRFPARNHSPIAMFNESFVRARILDFFLLFFSLVSSIDFLDCEHSKFEFQSSLNCRRSRSLT